MFKKLKYHTHENVGWGSISIPEQEMHTTATWLVPPAELVNRYDRDTLDGALIGLARVARTTARAAAHVRPARPRRAGPGAGAVHRPADALPLRRRARWRRPDRAALHASSTSSSAPAARPSSRAAAPMAARPASARRSRSGGAARRRRRAPRRDDLTMRDPRHARRDRLERLRGTPVARPRRSTAADDRIAPLARWFDARTEVAERAAPRSSSSARSPCPTTRRRAGRLLGGRLLRHRDDRPLDRRRHRDLPGRRRRASTGRA